MKRKIATMLLIAAILTQTLASCGSTGNGNDTSSNDTSSADTSSAADTSASGSESSGAVSLADIGKAIENEFGEDYGANMDIDSEMLEATYGIKPEWVADSYSKIPMMSFNSDLFIGVRATEGNADNIEKALKSYDEYNKSNALQYPINVPKIDAGRVYRSGDYVFYIILGVMDMDAEDSANKKTAEEYNQRAVDVIDAQLGK